MIFFNKYKKILSNYSDYELLKKLESHWVEYEFWLKKNAIVTKDILFKKNKLINSFYKKKPKISFILPLYNPNFIEFHKLVRSILIQPYLNYELCIYDDCSLNRGYYRIIKKYEKFAKIKFKQGNKNLGISYATYEAIKLADGDFVAFIDQDDELMPDTLFHFVREYNINEFDIFYSDYDRLSNNNKKYFHFFKPNWSPNYLFSLNYISHFDVYRRDIIDKEVFLKKFDGAQDYYLILACSLKTDKIFHFPKICYSWRESSNSTALDSKNKLYAYENAKLSIKTFIKEANIGYGIKDVIDINDKIKGVYSIIFDKNKFSNNNNILITPLKDFNIAREYFKEFVNEFYAGDKIEVNTLKRYDNIIFILDNIMLPDNFKLESLLGYASFKNNGFVSPKFLKGNKIHNVGIYLNNNKEPFWAFKEVNEYNENNDAGYGYIKLATKDVMAACPIFSIVKVETLLNNIELEQLAINFKEILKYNLVLYKKNLFNVVVASEKVFITDDIDKKYILDKSMFMGIDRDKFYNVNLTNRYFDFGLDI